MKQLVLVIASLYGMFSVILGALGAHAFKKILSPDKMESFETAVRYQMYHAIVLLVIGLYFNFENKLEKTMAWFFIDGVFLFSVSIYLLSFADHWGVNFRFLGPVTPIGGILMIGGWGLLLYILAKRF